MNRTAFLVSYIVLALASGGVGSSWTLTIVYMRFAAMGAAALATPAVIVLLTVPIALIVVTFLRAKRIGKPWLVWLPVAALLASLLQPTIGLLGLKLGLGGLAPYVFTLLSIITTQAPLILHTVCATLGAQNRSE